MKKKQNRHSLHLIRQNVPQFILLVIFSVLLGISVIAVSVLMKMFLDIATNASAMPLTTCLIIAVGVLLVLGISQVVTSVLQGKLSCRMELSLRSAMVEHLYRTDLRTFDSGAADNYFTRMTKDAETLSNFYSKTLIPSIFFESFTFVVSFILMFLLEWKLAVVMIVVVPILIFTMIRISPKLEMNSIQIMQNEDKNRNILQEFLSQYMLFKSYGVLGWVQKRVGNTYAQKQKYVGKLSVLQGAIGFLNNFLGVGMFIIALGMGSFLVVRGETTVGTLIAVVNLVSFFYGPVLHISGWMAEVNEVKVSTNRIGEILSMPTENSTQTANPAVQNAGSAALPFLRDNLGRSHTKRRDIVDVPGQDADLAVDGGNRQTHRLAVKALPVRGHDLQMICHAFSPFALATTSSMEPANRNADSGISSCLPSMISLKPRMVSFRGTYLPW